MVKQDSFELTVWQAFRATDDDMLRRSISISTVLRNSQSLPRAALEWHSWSDHVRNITSSGCTACCCLLQAL